MTSLIFYRPQEMFSVCTEGGPGGHYGIPPRKKGHTESTTGRGAAAQEAPEEPARVAEDATAPSESEAETTGFPDGHSDVITSWHPPTKLQALFGQQSHCTHMAFEVHSEHYDSILNIPTVFQLHSSCIRELHSECARII